MLPLSAAVFFTSGFAALLYQVIWQRLLVLFSGADLYSVTIIVASFMGGMGVYLSRSIFFIAAGRLDRASDPSPACRESS